MDARTLAATVLTDVIGARRSLGATLALRMGQATAPRDRALVQELCYGVMRWHLRLAAVIGRLMERPLKPGNDDIHCLLLLGLYQLIYMRVPAHAAISATVESCKHLKKPWATGLVNGVLRAFQRDAGALLAQVDRDAPARTAHPAWLLERLQRSWPDCWQALLDANNRHAPMTLRVNRRRIERDAYMEQLQQAGHAARIAPHAPAGITLEKPLDVAVLPGFAAGLVSVQDAAAQLAAPLLDVQAGQRVLDACAAPGGKTAHLLEVQPALQELVAIDSDAGRAARIDDNLRRLGLRARVVVADAAQPDAWWDGRAFDRILLDAPCSATGVIRRHPDIKYLRRRDDIDAVAGQQRRLLESLWPLLGSGGMLLYATCSVLAEENVTPIEQFLRSRDDVVERRIEAAWGHQCAAGRQILPGEDDMDGFYYACLQKT